jgi:hypothetical protein
MEQGTEKGVPESQLMQLKAFLLGLLPVLRDIKEAREWEQGTIWEGGEVMVSVAPLVKAALLVPMASVVTLMLLLLLLLFKLLIARTMGGFRAQGLALPGARQKMM